MKLLKIDFPRVLYPQSAEQFFALAALGTELRQLHLLEHSAVNKPITKYTVFGVPSVAWEFYIGSYSPPRNGSKTGMGKNSSSMTFCIIRKLS